MNTPVDCLAGTPCPQRGLLDQPQSEHARIFYFKVSENARLHVTAPPGTVVVITDSFGNYLASNYLGPNSIVLDYSGATLRHLLQVLNDPGIRTLLSQAGAVVLYGFGANSIGYEIANGRTESQMYGNVDYILEGLAGWLTGKVVWVKFTPCKDPYTADPNLTNARLSQCSQYLANRFAEVVDVNATLAPQGQLLLQYAEPNADGSLCHLNRAGIDVVWDAVRARLATLGVSL